MASLIFMVFVILLSFVHQIHGGCYSDKMVKEMHVYSIGGKLENSSSIDNCLERCISDVNCVGVDVGFDSDPMQCWVYTNGEDLLLHYPSCSFVQYRRQRCYISQSCNRVEAFSGIGPGMVAAPKFVCSNEKECAQLCIDAGSRCGSANAAYDRHHFQYLCYFSDRVVSSEYIWSNPDWWYYYLVNRC